MDRGSGGSRSSQSSSTDNGELPRLLTSGVPMLKVSSKKIKPVIVTLSPTQITWPSLKGGKVEIKSIRELRLGVSPTDQYDGARWITIVYVRGGQWKVVHFIAHTDDVYALWSDTLNDLVSAESDRVVSGKQHGPATDPDLVFIRQLWPVGATKVDRSTATVLCHQLGLVVTPAQMQKYQFPLDMSSFRLLVRDVQTRPELAVLFEALGGDMDRNKVRSFLRDVQQEEWSDDDIDLLYDRFADAKTNLWTADSFASFLASPDNVPKTDQDLTRPIPEYFVATSHNTYLVANQWRGDSTVEGYIRVLLDGCRSVEIDVHNGDTGPVVTHGNTMTSSVPILDVCQAIKKYAFIASPYPVIVSLEVRCSVEQQDLLAQTITNVFDDLVVTAPLPGVEGIPSPEDLKGRILIKAKNGDNPQRSQSASASLSPPLSTSPSHGSHDSTTTDSTTESDSSFVKMARRLSLVGGERERAKPPKPKKASSVSRLLSELPVYTAGVKYGGFSKLVNYEAHHMFSVSESTAMRIIKDGQEPDWIKHNFTHLTRVYPKGVRLTSSNFDPRPFWGAGAQMVAINYQTLDEGSLWNHAMFHAGGYVLKPLALRTKTNEEPLKYRVRIRIVSAQRLPPMQDMYVDATVGETTKSTREIKDPSLNPKWDETLEFKIKARPSCLSLIFARLEIRGPRGIIAQWARPITAAGNGFRYLPLEDSTRSRFLFATLFVRMSCELADPSTKLSQANSLTTKLSQLRPVSPLLRPITSKSSPVSPLLPAPSKPLTPGASPLSTPLKMPSPSVVPVDLPSTASSSTDSQSGLTIGQPNQLPNIILPESPSLVASPPAAVPEELGQELTAQVASPQEVPTPAQPI